MKESPFFKVERGLMEGQTLLKGWIINQKNWKYVVHAINQKT